MGRVSHDQPVARVERATRESGGRARVGAWLVVAAGIVGGCGNGSATEPGSSQQRDLTFDSELCRNTGQVVDGSVLWVLSEPVPLSWRYESPKTGTFQVLEESRATFAVEDTVLTLGKVSEDICNGWEGN